MNKKGLLCIVLAAFIFSTMEISGKMVAKQLNPFQLTFIRFLIGGIILLPFALKDIKSKNLKLSKNDILYFAIAGFLCVPASMSLLQLAVVYTKASTTAIIFCTNPIFTVPFAYFLLKEKVDKSTFISIILSLIGVAFIFNPFGMTIDYKGITFAILAAITFSLYTVISKMRIEKYGGFIFNCLTFLIGDVILFIILLVFRIPMISGINKNNIPIILYLGVILTGFGYIVYLKAIQETSAVASSMVFFIKPALAPLLSLIILGEVIHINTLAGIAFIILGSYIGTQRKKKSLDITDVQ